MDVSTIIKLGVAVIFLACREQMPRRAASLIGLVFVVMGAIELLSRDGPYFGFVGVGWLVVGALYLIFLIPGTTAWIRSGATKGKT